MYPGNSISSITPPILSDQLKLSITWGNINVSLEISQSIEKQLRILYSIFQFV
jgi:hypothetical protein